MTLPTENFSVIEILSDSESKTEALGFAVAKLLVDGGVLALHGELGSGKTTFVRGLVKYLVGDISVHSPSFTLVNEYGKVSNSGETKLYHVDLYRSSSTEELYDLPFEEILDGTIPCVVEWAEKANKFLPTKRLDVYFFHVNIHTRKVKIFNRGLFPRDWQNKLMINLADLGIEMDLS